MADQKPKIKQSEFVRWFAPLLQALKDLGGSAAPREALERIAEIEKVSDIKSCCNWRLLSTGRSLRRGLA